MTYDLTRNPAAFVTFYSFKGGVGRSMALINVAGILAGSGFRVLALDMDLEAPGLSYLMQDEARQSAESRPGFVDLLADACSRGPDADLFALEPAEVVERYSYVYTVPDAIRQSDDGLLRIMPAGRLDGDYQARLDALTLGQLYRDGRGQPLIAAFKQVLQEAQQFDFVFVDSRTGFSDEAGICTRDLADCLMIVMGLNRQNVSGTATFLHSLRQAGVSKAIRVALSPVPSGEDELVEQREKEAEESLSKAYGQPVSLSLQIPYHPRLALTEEPHIFRRSRGYLYDAYVRIENAVLAMVGHSPDAFRRAIESAVKDRRIDDVIRHLKRLRKLDRESYFLDPVVTSRPFVNLCLEEDAGELRHWLAASLPAHSWTVTYLANMLRETKPLDAELFYRRALEGDPKDVNSYVTYANFLSGVRRDHDGAEALYKQALALDPKDVNSRLAYAYFLTAVRRDHDGAEALYKQALALDPKDVDSRLAYAYFLTGIRKDHDGAEALYKQALELDPKDVDIWVAYADFLSDVRKDHNGAEAIYKQVREVEPKDVDGRVAYATFLTTVRKDHDGAEALYKQALEVDPKATNALGAYANFLTDVRHGYEDAEVLYKRALQVEPRDANSLGNYAKLLFILDRNEEAIAFLASAWEQGSSERALQCELHFYACAHAWQRWPNSLAELKRLLLEGAKSEGWLLEENVNVATRRGHPAPEFLAALARVVSGQALVEILDEFPAWQDARF